MRKIHLVREVVTTEAFVISIPDSDHEAITAMVLGAEFPENVNEALAGVLSASMDSGRLEYSYEWDDSESRIIRARLDHESLEPDWVYPEPPALGAC